MRQGRFITAAAAAVAVLAIGPAGALATPGSFTDDAAGDFAAGTIPASAWTVEPGSVALKGGTVADNFDGTTLGDPPVGPHPWTATKWADATPGGATVGGGSVTVDGGHVNDTQGHGDYSAGKVLEFRATFGPNGSAGSQNVGFGDTFFEAPWAMFSTGDGTGTGLFARSRASDGAQPVIPDTPIAVNRTVPHVYRIEWTTSPGVVKFFVDGALVATHNVTIEPMRPVISDFTANDSSSVKVDWLSMWEFATPPSGTFTSRVFDAGTAANLKWGTLTAGAADGLPVIQTRTGNSPVPDASWSTFTPLGAGGAIQSPVGRYIQYSAALTGSTPGLDSVTINYDIATPAGGSGGSGGSGGTGNNGSGGTQGGGNSATATDKTKPKVTLVAATLRATKKGAVSFTYGCPSTEKSCTITLKLKSGKKTVASKTFTVKGGKSKAVTLVLSKDARKVLAKRGSLKVSAVVKATDAAGNARTTTKAMTIRRATH